MTEEGLDELKRAFTVERVIALAESEGLDVAHQRIQCPQRCSTDKRGASVGDRGGVAVWHCKHCGKGGSVLDLVMATRSIDVSGAIEVLKAEGPLIFAAPKKAELPKIDAGETWRTFLNEDGPSCQYLRNRGLEAALSTGLVRFNVGRNGNAWLAARAREGYRVAMALYSRDGALFSAQIRSISPQCEPKKTKLALAGVKYPAGGLAFGSVSKARAAPRVFLTEGMADTLALAIADVTVLGAPGVDQVRHLAGFLGELQGRTVVLCPQNDRPDQVRLSSADAFRELQPQLEQLGAQVVIFSTPEPYKDPAEWLQAVGVDAFKASVLGLGPDPPPPGQGPHMNGHAEAPYREEPGCDDDDGSPAGKSDPTANLRQGSGTAPIKGWQTLLRFDEIQRPPFPLAALVPYLRGFVEELAAFAQVHADMPAMLALASLSTACAGRYHIQVRDEYSETLNLFIAVVMDSGDRKSSVFKMCTQPLRDVEAEMLLRARPAEIEAEQNRKNLEARLKSLQTRLAKEDNDGDRLQLQMDAVKAAKELNELPRKISPRLLADDITPQALAMVLEKCGEQIGVFAPEGGIFKILGGRYSDGQADLDLVLKAYSGEPVTVDRVSRAAVKLDHPLVTFGLTIQPRILQDLADTPGAVETGFAGRFLYSLPGSEVGQRTAISPAMGPEARIEYERKIRRLLEGRTPGQVTDAIRMTPAALAVRDSFHNEVEPRLKPGEGDLATPGMKEWARKLVGTMARIAGVLHCAQEPDPLSVLVSEETAKSAASICRYLIDHARAAILTMGTDVELERAKQVLDWLRRKRCERFTLRDVFESKRKTFEDKVPVLRATLELLEAHGYIRSVPDDRPGPGRKSEWFEVRPDGV